MSELRVVPGGKLEHHAPGYKPIRYALRGDEVSFQPFEDSIVIGTPEGGTKVIKPCHLIFMRSQDPLALVHPEAIERLCRPWKTAIKSLLKQHLPPIASTFVRDPQARHLGEETLGVLFTLEGSSVPPDVLVTKVLEQPHIFSYNGKHTQDVEAIEAAKRLHSKLESLRSLLRNHPNLNRVPMFRGDSVTEPRLEDRELNDLLKETATLARMHDDSFMILMQRSETIEWPHVSPDTSFLFSSEDFEDLMFETLKEVE